MRAALILEFISRRPIVMHDFDDELRFIRYCEAVWPCPKTSRLRAEIERERGIIFAN